MRCSRAVALATCIVSSQALQPGAAAAKPAPLRHLEFGDINFLHTTDTHGWYAGHLFESSYSADWGDYISFSEHLRQQLESEGKDLLIIDTGDRIEGNGLYDASDPQGEYTFGIFKQQHIDLLCSGNHELYKNSSAENDSRILVPAYKDNYLATNLQIINPNTGQFEPLAPSHRLFTTKHGVRILSFGFIFDFTRNDKNTVIIPVEILVKQDRFKNLVMKADVELVVIIGHIGLRSHEFEFIHKAIRAIKPDIPIQMFGGHFHIRDYRVFDDRAHALASGRFMETIGFQSISNIKPDSGKPIAFSRRYIDNNLYSLHYHSNTTSSTFTTLSGSYATRKITRARSALNLDQTLGCAPQPYWMSRSPYPSNDSLYTLLTDQIFPDIKNPDRTNRTRMLLTNTGAIRFDILEGPFSRDSTYIVSPFTSNMSFIPDVPYRLAKQLLPILNGDSRQTTDIMHMSTFNKKWKFDLEELSTPEQRSRNHVRIYSDERTRRAVHHESLHSEKSFDFEMDTNQLTTTNILFKTPVTPGYTTHDDLGDDGDDTFHFPIAFYDVPKCIQAILPSPSSLIPTDSDSGFKSSSSSSAIAFSSSYDSSKPNHASSVWMPSIPPLSHSADTEVVDLIFNQFITPYILSLLNILPYLDPTSSLQLEEYDDYKSGYAWAMQHSMHIPLCVRLGLCEDRSPPNGQKNMIEQMPEEVMSDFKASASEEKKAEKLVGYNEFMDAVSIRAKAKRNGDGNGNDEEQGEKMQVNLRKYTEEDVSNYVPGETLMSLLARWVSENWAGNCKDGHGDL